MSASTEGYDFQVVLEFQGDDSSNYDRLMKVESLLENKLKSGVVDGHDIGGGIINIFLETNDPNSCFREAMRIIAQIRPSPTAAGYRSFAVDAYQRLWPQEDHTPFELK